MLPPTCQIFGGTFSCKILGNTSEIWTLVYVRLILCFSVPTTLFTSLRNACIRPSDNSKTRWLMVGWRANPCLVHGQERSAQINEQINLVIVGTVPLDLNKFEVCPAAPAGDNYHHPPSFKFGENCEHFSKPVALYSTFCVLK